MRAEPIPVRQQLLYWGAGLAVFVLLLWLLSDALLPFVLGAGIAYLTDPLTSWLERRGVGRVGATVILTLLSVAVFAVALLLIIPLIVGQLREVIARAPEILDEVRALVDRVMPEAQREGSALYRALEGIRANARELSVRLVGTIWSGGMALVSFLALMFVTPVVAFYLLLDWRRLLSALDDLLPREHRTTIRGIARDIDHVLSGFLRGQLTVCLILGTFYAVALEVVGLNFGLLIGLFAGLVSFIPFVGSITGGLLSVGVAAAQFWDDPVWIGVVAAIFVIGQLVEGNFLTPKLVGDSVGLHPVWLLFALSAFGALFGFTGLLVAVPAAAVIGVVTRFLIARYKESRLYRGPVSDGTEP